MVNFALRGTLATRARRSGAAALVATALTLAGTADAQLLLQGHVTESASGLPIEGATVASVPAGPTVETDIAGHYSMDVAPGLITLEVSAAGYLPQTRELSVDADSVEDFALDLELFSITGLVTETVSGDPIASAQVRATPGGPTAVTDGVGSYALEVEAGSWTLEASAAGYIPSSREVTVAGELIEDFALETDPGVVIGGRVRDDLGRWLAGARVDLVGGQRTRTQTTAADGSFTFTGIAPNTLYSITASMEGHRSDSRNLNIGRSDLFDVILTLVYVPISYTLRGHVFDGTTNDPVTGALLSIPALDASTTSDRDGAFTFRLLPPDTHTVTARADGYATSSVDVTVVDADLEGLEIHLGRDGNALTLSGVVTIAGLELPIGGATVRITSSEGTEQQTITDLRGAYSFLGLASGRYDLVVTAGGYDPHAETLDLALPTEHDVELTRRPGQGFSLFGTVQLDGRPGGEWSDATLILASSETPDSVLAETGSEADGAYRFEDLAPGQYRLEAGHEGFVSAGLTVLVAADTVQHFILQPSPDSGEELLFGCDCSTGKPEGWLFALLLVFGLIGARRHSRSRRQGR